jgi:hypothetical protein
MRPGDFLGQHGLEMAHGGKRRLHAAVDRAGVAVEVELEEAAAQRDQFAVEVVERADAEVALFLQRGDRDVVAVEPFQQGVDRTAHVQHGGSWDLLFLGENRRAGCCGRLAAIVQLQAHLLAGCAAQPADGPVLHRAVEHRRGRVGQRIEGLAVVLDRQGNGSPVSRCTADPDGPGRRRRRT